MHKDAILINSKEKKVFTEILLAGILVSSTPKIDVVTKQNVIANNEFSSNLNPSSLMSNSDKCITEVVWYHFTTNSIKYRYRCFFSNKADRVVTVPKFFTYKYLSESQVKTGKELADISAFVRKNYPNSGTYYIRGKDNYITKVNVLPSSFEPKPLIE
ncbi:MAG: hypothetical protein AAGF07_00090 [Patescibacteria group bacterium]